MYTISEITSMLFFDTETVSKYPNITELKEKEPLLYESWVTKIAKYQDGYDKLSENEIYIKYAGLFPEYSKIVCVSFGRIKIDNLMDKNISFKLVSYASHDEAEILEKCWGIFEKASFLAGFNIIDFDVPLLCRKFLYHGIMLPKSLSIRGKKPWEIVMSDTMKDLMFGSMKKLSLERVSLNLNLGTSKGGAVKGENLCEKYWEGISLNDIQTYCEEDVQINMDVVVKLTDINLREPKHYL